MKKSILSVLVLSFAISAINAQEIPERKREESKPVIKERLMNKKERANLNFSEEQKAKFKAMNQDFRKKMEELRKQESLTVKDYREKMETLRKEQREKIQSMLTPDQKTEMQKYRDAAKLKTKTFDLKKQAKLKERLNLSDDQLAKIKKDRESTMERIKTIRENKALSDIEKKEKIKESMKDQKESMKSILTEEQLQKIKENRKRSGRKRQVI